MASLLLPVFIRRARAGCVLLLASLAWTARAEPAEFTAVRQANEQRLTATLHADTAMLAKLLSDDLRYAHSDGRVQTKQQFLGAVAGNRIKYTSFTTQDAELQAVSPHVVIMHGRAALAALADGRPVAFTLRFLSVWRLEGDQWRLFAYQSSQLAPAP